MTNRISRLAMEANDFRDTPSRVSCDSDRRGQLSAEMRRYGIHAIRDTVRVVVQSPPPSLAVRFRAADMIRDSHVGMARKAS